MTGIAGELGFVPTASELQALPASVGHWPPFADTVAALLRLQTRYKLVVISNIDDAMLGFDGPEEATARCPCSPGQEGVCSLPQGLSCVLSG